MRDCRGRLPLLSAAAASTRGRSREPTPKVQGRIGLLPSVSSRRPTSRSSYDARVTLTWLGHSAFRFDTPGGKRVYIDPFLNVGPESELEPEVDRIALTHGHGDHVGDTVDLAKKTGRQRRSRRSSSWTGCRSGRASRMSSTKGGPVEADVKLMLTTRTTPARTTTSSTWASPWALSPRSRTGRSLYFAGTARLRRHAAHPAPLCTGRGDTADRRPLHDGAERSGGLRRAARGTRRVPCHYGTFPPLVGTPAELRELAPDVQVEEMEPGHSVTL